jgi:hypothetical protein
MTRPARCALLTAALALALPAYARDFYGPHDGREITHKSFMSALGPDKVPANPPPIPELFGQGYQDSGWVVTSMPLAGDETFIKFFDDTTLECFGAFDIIPTPNDTVNAGISIDYNRWGMLNIAAASDSWGHLITIASGPFDFHGIPAGPHVVTVNMASQSKRAFTFNAQAANLQCKEIAEPRDQTRPPFHAPAEGGHQQE